MWGERPRSIPEEVEEGTKDRPILDVVLFQGKGRHEYRKNLVKRHSGIVAVNKSCNSACCIVFGIQPGAMCIGRDIEEGAKGSEERKILRGEIDRGVLHQETDSETCVALDFCLVITESSVKEFQQGLRVRSDGTLNPGHDFC